MVSSDSEAIDSDFADDSWSFAAEPEGPLFGRIAPNLPYFWRRFNGADGVAKRGELRNP